MSTVVPGRAHSASQYKRGRLSYILLFILFGVGLVLFSFETELWSDDYYADEAWVAQTYSKEEIAKQVLDLLDPQIKRSIIHKNTTDDSSEVASEVLKKVEELVKGLENNSVKEKSELKKERTRLETTNADVAKYVKEIKVSQDKNEDRYNSLLRELERSQEVVVQLKGELRALKNKKLVDKQAEEVVSNTTKEVKAQETDAPELKSEEIKRIIANLFEYVIKNLNVLQEKQNKDVPSTMSSIEQAVEKLMPLLETYSKLAPRGTESIESWTKNKFEGFKIEVQNLNSQYAMSSQSADKKAEKVFKKAVKKVLSDARSLKESFLVL